MSDWILGSPNWLRPASFLLITYAIVLVWSYRRILPENPKMLVALLLKCAGIFLLCVCLLEPRKAIERPRPQANAFAILVDSSQSMLVDNDSADDVKRRRQRDLDDQSPWQLRLAQDFRLRRYRFDEVLVPVADFADIQFDGWESRLYSTIQDLSNRFRDVPLAGVLLFSDGNATDSKTNASLESIPFPIYPVLPVGISNVRDLRIGSLTVRNSEFETAPVSIDATLEHDGLKGRTALVRIHDSSGVCIEEKSIVLGSTRDVDAVSFRFRPRTSGVSSYRIETVLRSEASAIDRGRTREEVTLVNNHREFLVDRGRGPFRILYVAGRPNWEHKFLKRAIEEDDELRMASLIRIAHREPMFNFRDVRVESSNPLFSGFEDIPEEEKERFDQQVFIRLGMESEWDSATPDIKSRGFPKSAEELFSYEAIILDDLEVEFFNQEQMLLLRQFVSRRGGVLVMLGGQESYLGKNFQDTPLGELLPVYIASDDRSGKWSGTQGELWRFGLTREGWLEPFMRLRETEAAEQVRLQNMPNFAVRNRIRATKPGSTMLATIEAVDKIENAIPSIVWQRFGRGRTASVLVGDLWRWQLQNPEPNAPGLSTFWRQFTRWLISDVPKRVSARWELPADEGPATRELVVTVLNERFLPDDSAQIIVRLTRPAAEPLDLIAAPSPNVAGEYRLNVAARSPGVYLAEVEAQSGDGSRIDTAQAGFVSEPAQKEFESIVPNRTNLEELAKRTGGKLLRTDELDRFVERIPTEKVPVVDYLQEPLWHRAWVITAALICLFGEWWFRRRSGLS